jgi:hypothetical protein
MKCTCWHCCRLVSILRSDPGPQMVYQVSFCIWLLTFEPEIAKDINRWALPYRIRNPHWTNDRQYDIIPLLTEAAQSAVKEKVVRVILATFKVCMIQFPLRRFSSFIESRLESTRQQPSCHAGGEITSLRQELVNKEMDRRWYHGRHTVSKRRVDCQFSKSNVSWI